MQQKLFRKAILAPALLLGMQVLSSCAGTSAAMRPSYAPAEKPLIECSKSQLPTPQKQTRSAIAFPIIANADSHSIVDTTSEQLCKRFVEGEVGNDDSSFINRELSIPIIQQATQYLGSRYKSGGTGPNGFDCSGYVWRVYSEAGIELNRASSGDYFKIGEKAAPHEALPGDMIFFRERGRINHVGIYLGSNKFIHSSSGRGVIESSMEDDYWKPRIAGFRRFGS